MMEMQGNATEIDERNLLQLDALLSHGYGLSPQLVMRSKGLSIEAKALYGYLSSFAGAGDTAFPSTSRILEELDISKNRFYKIRKELVSWGFISIETTATSAGLRTVYTLPQNPIAIKTEIDEIANRRNEIKSSLVANLHNEDMVSHKGDSESERLQQSAGNEPCRQSEAKAQNRGSNLKPCLQSEDEGCLQSGDKLYMEITDGALATVNSIVAAPAAISTASVPMLYAIGLAITVLIVWLYTFMYAGNYRYGEEAGSAKWGTLKEGVAFKDQTDPSNNLLFTKNYGLALKKPKFDLEHDRNLNVMVIGGSGSGKTRNYVKPNLMQLNASYFLTDPKGTSLPECGYLFRDNGYRIKVFNTIEFNKSMHYNPLKYVKTDADILSFVNCLISNTNGDKQSGGDPFWENSERLLYTALIALLRDWFPPEDYSLDGLLTLLSMAEAKENDENFKSPLDMIFDEIETGKVYERNPFYQGPSTSSSYADAESDRMAISENTTDEFTWQSSLMERNNDGLSPAREGGLTSDQDFALANYKMFKVAAGKTLKSIIISCNVRMAPMRIEQVRELLKYDEMNLDEMTKCGEVSYALLANCQIASPEVTEKLFESMNEVGRFSRKPSDVINTVTDMVVHDMKAMQDNIGALDGMKLGDGNAIVIGKCPKCGKDLYATKNQFRCAGVHFKKTGEKDGKAVFAQDGTCDFSIYRFVGPKDKPKKLTDKNGREIAEKGKTSLIKGIKKKSGDGTYDAYLTLNRETWSLDMQFPEFKGKKHKG